MSLDKRVRDALERTSLSVDPDVPRDLSSVRRKTRRAMIRQRITIALVASGPGGARRLHWSQGSRRHPEPAASSRQSAVRGGWPPARVV